MATIKPFARPKCGDMDRSGKQCQRESTQIVLRGDNGPLEGSYCGAHVMKHLNLVAKAEGKGEPGEVEFDEEAAK